jgi:hypothetical protein
MTGRLLALAVATAAAVALGTYAGTTVPEPTTVPAYEDERYQDPSGYPYCTYPDDGLRPCIEAQTQVVRP